MRTPLKSNIQVKIISELHELSDEFRVETAATINLGTPTASVIEKVEVPKSNAFSQRHVIVECKITGEYQYDRLKENNLRLTAEAKNYLALHNYAGFREQYGDYYVAGLQRRFKFYAIMVCR